LATRTWSRGVVASYSYNNAKGELTGVSYSDSTPAVSLSYNRLGQKSAVTDAVGSRTFSYDAHFLLTSEAITGLYGKTLGRSYDALGRASSLTIGSEYSTGYSYDAVGRIGSVSSGSDSFTYSYLANSDLISGIAYPNGITAAKSYETARDLISSVENKFGQTSVSKYDYVNDVIGRRTSMAKSGSAFSASDSIAYGYNARSEVTSAAAQTETAYNYAFNFDNIGNRTTATERGTAFTYTANNRNQYSLINDGADKTPSHDFDGNMTGNGNGWTYTWDAENRLATATNGTQTLQFTYDYLSRRVEKKVLSGETVVKDERFVYDGFQQIEKLDAANSNAILQKFVWLNQRLLGVTDASTSTSYYAMQDANKNITELLDGSGNVAAHYEYSPFGKVTVSNGAYASANPFRFSSEYADDETGLVYYNFRYYAPELGRWLSKEPLEELGSSNLYSYVGNRSINTWDMEGLDAADIAGGNNDPADRMLSRATGSGRTASMGSEFAGCEKPSRTFHTPPLKKVAKRAVAAAINALTNSEGFAEAAKLWNGGSAVDKVIAGTAMAVMAVDVVTTVATLGTEAAAKAGVKALLKKAAAKDAGEVLAKSEAKVLTAEEISAINRENGGVTSLTGNPNSVVANQQYRDGFWDKAAVAIRDIAGGHMFDNGNKRTAQAVVEEMMQRNGATGATSAQIRSVIDRAATGELRSVEEISAALQ